MSTMSFERAAGADRPSRILPGFLTRIAGGVRTYLSRAQAERYLETLDDRLLSDMGLRRSEIHQMVWGGDQQR